MRLRLAIAIALFATALPCVSQDTLAQDAMPSVKSPAVKTSTEPTGKLTGTVYCSDTNLPARLADVHLIPANGSNSSQQTPQTVTDLEGRFFFDGIVEGDYYVVAVEPGYLDLLRVFTESLKSSDPDDHKAFEALAATVQISANQPAEASVRLERAGEIDGTVRYDDGSPAISLRVTARPKPAQSDTTQSGAGATQPATDSYASFVEVTLQTFTTDDRGQFRLLGVAPGEYLVSTTLPAFSSDAGGSFLDDGKKLNVYSGSSFRAGTADSVKISSGDAAVDADITIPLGKLHTIRGRVSLKSTNQPAPFALVRLLFADTKEIVQTVSVQDGQFEIHYVPEDSFILRAVALTEPLRAPEGADEANYYPGATQMDQAFASASQSPANAQDSSSPTGPSDTPLVVTGDMDNIVVAVADPQPTPSGNAEPAAASSSPESAPADNSAPADDSK